MVPLLSIALAFALQIGGASSPAASVQPDEAVPKPDANGVYHSLRGITPPEVVHQVEPKYSNKVSDMKLAGRTVVGLVVDPKGRPINVHVVRSIAEDVQDPKDKTRVTDLDEKAIDAVRKYRFKPAMLNGSPVPVELNVQVDFKIF